MHLCASMCCLMFVPVSGMANLCLFSLLFLNILSDTWLWLFFTLCPTLSVTFFKYQNKNMTLDQSDTHLTWVQVLRRAREIIQLHPHFTGLSAWFMGSKEGPNKAINATCGKWHLQLTLLTLVDIFRTLSTNHQDTKHRSSTWQMYRNITIWTTTLHSLAANTCFCI